MSVSKDDLTGGVFKDCYGRIVRVRGTEIANDDSPSANMVCDELVGPHTFTLHSEYAAELVPYDHPYHVPTGRVRLVTPTPYYSDLEKSLDEWRERAVKYQNLSYERRPLLEKIGAPLAFVFLVIPWRMWQRWRGYTGPFS